MYPVTADTWAHTEVILNNFAYDFPMNIMIEDYEGTERTVSDCSIDNIIVSSIHGPLEYNIGA